VQHNLHHEIDRLETRLKVVDIGVMPLAVIILTILMAIGSRRRR
jgi:hypothetical protein